MLTLTSEYALRAMVYLTRHSDDWPIPGGRIAEAMGIPPKYLSNILSSLVRAGVLEAARGKGGGFKLARGAREISLHSVLSPFEGVLANRRPCPFGNEVCSDDDPCAGHERWRRVRETYSEFLKSTSVYDVTIRKNGARAKSRSGKRKE